MSIAVARSGLEKRTAPMNASRSCAMKARPSVIAVIRPASSPMQPCATVPSNRSR